MNQTDAAERLESLKAGIVGAISTAVAYLLTALAHLSLASQLTQGILDSLKKVDAIEMIQLAIALLTGFLFAVTYRYVIRQDSNPQLKAGAVLAFGLVRGFAQIEIEITSQSSFGWLGIRVLESVLMFTMAYLALDWFMRLNWLKPFGSNCYGATRLD
jgi:hypothetical protein